MTRYELGQLVSLLISHFDDVELAELVVAYVPSTKKRIDRLLNLRRATLSSNWPLLVKLLGRLKLPPDTMRKVKEIIAKETDIFPKIVDLISPVNFEVVRSTIAYAHDYYSINKYGCIFQSDEPVNVKAFLYLQLVMHLYTTNIPKLALLQRLCVSSSPILFYSTKQEFEVIFNIIHSLFVDNLFETIRILKGSDFNKEFLKYVTYDPVCNKVIQRREFVPKFTDIMVNSDEFKNSNKIDVFKGLKPVENLLFPLNVRSIALSHDMKYLVIGTQKNLILYEFQSKMIINIFWVGKVHDIKPMDRRFMWIKLSNKSAILEMHEKHPKIKELPQIPEYTICDMVKNDNTCFCVVRTDTCIKLICQKDSWKLPDTPLCMEFSGENAFLLMPKKSGEPQLLLELDTEANRISEYNLPIKADAGVHFGGLKISQHDKRTIALFASNGRLYLFDRHGEWDTREFKAPKFLHSAPLCKFIGQWDRYILCMSTEAKSHKAFIFDTYLPGRRMSIPGDESGVLKMHGEIEDDRGCIFFSNQKNNLVVYSTN